MRHHQPLARKVPLGQPWLRGLLGTLHVRQATVITFNQDTLLEMAVEEAGLFSWDRRRWPAFEQPQVQWWDLLDGQPPLPPSRMEPGTPQQTFRLLKLHGSTNWFWQTGDVSGATTARWFLPGELGPSQAIPNEAAALRRELPLRVPLIIPPAAAKSAYYQTPLVAQLWRDARSALAGAAGWVSLIGYSMPPTDLVTSGMLREALIERRSAKNVAIEVVNPRPAEIRKHFKALGATARRISVVNSVEQFAMNYQRRAARDLVDAFRAWKPDDVDCRLLVGSCLKEALKVVAITTTSDREMELHLEDGVPPFTGTNVSPTAPAPVGLSTFLLDLAGPVDRVVAVRKTGERRLVIGATEHIMNLGAGNGRWQMLITAASFSG